MKTRQMILELAGHKFLAATNKEEVEQACRENDIDVIVIGQAISYDEKYRVRDQVRRQCPTGKILELYIVAPILTDADDWLEIPAAAPTDLAQRVSELTASRRDEAKPKGDTQ